MEAPPTATVRLAGWQRLLVIAFTVIVLVSIYHQLDLRALGHVLSRLKPGWLTGALALHGLLILAAVARLHLALRLTDSVVHLAATARSVIIGHFFSVTLSGPGVSDVARCHLYARWYRFGFPPINAAAKLGGLMGLSGLLLLTGVVFAIGAARGAFSGALELDTNVLPLWIWLAAVAAAFGIFLLLQKLSNLRDGRRQFCTVLSDGAARLARRPHVAAGGVMLGGFVQAALCFLIALNLRAVSDQELDWLRLLWLFPVIHVFSSLPLTVAGLGLREAAAITLLGLYDVPREEAAAAALLTFGVTAFWAAIGGIVLWREGSSLGRLPVRPPVESIAVVIPTLNEAVELPETLRRLRQVPEFKEIIVVDGGSTDATRAIAEAAGCRVLRTEPGRGKQLRAGARATSADVVLMIHADTWVFPRTGTALLNCLRDPLVVGGGFWKHFREYPNPILYGSRFRCAIRLLFGQRILGDQGLFVRRDVLEKVGGVPDVELMEEFRLCELLRSQGRLALADERIVTSARRFARFGTLRTYWLMWWVTFQYRRGVPSAELRKLYETGGRAK